VSLYIFTPRQLRHIPRDMPIQVHSPKVILGLLSHQLPCSMGLISHPLEAHLPFKVLTSWEFPLWSAEALTMHIASRVFLSAFVWTTIFLASRRACATRGLRHRPCVFAPSTAPNRRLLGPSPLPLDLCLSRGRRRRLPA
jgi:hypothetical protein